MVSNVKTSKAQKRKLVTKFCVLYLCINYVKVQQMGSEKGRIIYKAKSKSDDDELLEKCFKISTDVEMKEVPFTGEEYLLKVIAERQNVAEVTVCDKDITQFAKNQSRFYKEPPRTKSAPDKLKPTIEWQRIQVSDFADVRKYLTDLKTHLLKKGIWDQKVKTLKIHDQSLVGWKVFFQDHEPSVTCMLGFTPELQDMGLEMLTDILEEVQPGDTVDYKIGQWIYAFLARLRHPPLSETISLLRNLARTCGEIRAKINQDEEDAALKATPLNLFICIVARYFEQLDLADY